MECKRCEDDYDKDDLTYGYCEDCLDTMQTKTLEEQLEDIGII